MEAEQNDDNVTFIYSVIRDTFNSQQKQKNTLETKASTVIAFTGVMFALLMGGIETFTNLPTTSQSLTLVSIALFAISLILAISVSWVTRYRSDPNPETLAKNYLNSTKEETQLQIISNWIMVWKNNTSILERNANYLRGSFMFQFFALLLLGIALFFTIL